eukprot:scaffold1282_cov251-Pinguiococcus_pyrenoidosus.AAC.58
MELREADGASLQRCLRALPGIRWSISQLRSSSSKRAHIGIQVIAATPWRRGAVLERSRTAWKPFNQARRSRPWALWSPPERQRFLARRLPRAVAVGSATRGCTLPTTRLTAGALAELQGRRLTRSCCLGWAGLHPEQAHLSRLLQVRLKNARGAEAGGCEDCKGKLTLQSYTLQGSTLLCKTHYFERFHTTNCYGGDQKVRDFGAEEGGLGAETQGATEALLLMYEWKFWRENPLRSRQEGSNGQEDRRDRMIGRERYTHTNTHF